MMMHHLSKGLISSVLALTAVGAIAPPSLAGFFHNGWHYAIDVGYDSYGTVNGNIQVGNTIYEIYGMAIRENTETGEIWVGLNSNMPITGRDTGPQLCVSSGACYPILNNSISWGDMFFDFSGTGNFKTAIDSGQMFGVRFADNNDSGVNSGVYRITSAMNVAGQNAGFRNLAHYNQLAQQNGNLDGLRTWMGDLAWTDSYYDGYNVDDLVNRWSNTDILMPNVIESGEKLNNSSVTYRTQAELEAQGFNLDQFFATGDNVFGFSFQKPLEFVGNFFATILQECINDGMALLGYMTPEHPDNPEPPPESTYTPVGAIAPDDKCPVTLGQLKSLAPDSIDGPWKKYYNVESNLWYDPEAYLGYTFKTEGDTVFTQILDFPCGIAANEEFYVFIGDKQLAKSAPPGEPANYTFNPGESLNFAELGEYGVQSFSIIFPNLKPDIAKIEFQLGFDKEIGTFSMRALTDDEVRAMIPEPSLIVGLSAIALLSSVITRKR